MRVDTVNMDTACDWVMAKLVSTQHMVGVMAKLVLHSISKTTSTNIGSIHEPSCMIGYRQYEYLSTML